MFLCSNILIDISLFEFEKCTPITDKLKSDLNKYINSKDIFTYSTNIQTNEELSEPDSSKKMDSESSDCDLNNRDMDDEDLFGDSFSE